MQVGGQGACRDPRREARVGPRADTIVAPDPTPIPGAITHAPSPSLPPSPPRSSSPPRSLSTPRPPRSRSPRAGDNTLYQQASGTRASNGGIAQVLRRHQRHQRDPPRADRLRHRVQASIPHGARINLGGAHAPHVAEHERRAERLAPPRDGRLGRGNLGCGPAVRGRRGIDHRRRHLDPPLLQHHAVVERRQGLRRWVDRQPECAGYHVP